MTKYGQLRLREETRPWTGTASIHNSSNHHKPMCWLSATQKQSGLLTTLSHGADVESGQGFKRKLFVLCCVQIQDFVIDAAWWYLPNHISPECRKEVMFLYITSLLFYFSGAWNKCWITRAVKLFSASTRCCQPVTGLKKWQMKKWLTAAQHMSCYWID